MTRKDDNSPDGGGREARPAHGVASATAPHPSVHRARVARRNKRRGRYTIDLPAHMAECDANYLRLLKLFPDLRQSEGRHFQVLLGPGRAPADVTLSVLERGPYTTLIRLTQLPEQPWSINPRMTIRIYHDARSAEVVDYQEERRFQAVYDYPNPAMRQRDEKVQINRFLGEFLAVCLDQGVSPQGVALAER